MASKSESSIESSQQSLQLTRDIVENVSKLARLKLNDSETNEMVDVLSKVLAHFEQISKVDTTDVRPLVTPTDMSMTLREDELDLATSNSASSDQLLENATERSGKLYKVPPVV